MIRGGISLQFGTLTSASHVSAKDVRIAAGFLYGLAEMSLEDISFSDISISLSGSADPGHPEMADDIPTMSRAGFFIRNDRRLRFDNVVIDGQGGPAFDIDDSVETEIHP